MSSVYMSLSNYIKELILLLVLNEQEVRDGEFLPQAESSLQVFFFPPLLYFSAVVCIRNANSICKNTIFIIIFGKNVVLNFYP